MALIQSGPIDPRTGLPRDLGFNPPNVDEGQLGTLYPEPAGGGGVYEPGAQSTQWPMSSETARQILSGINPNTGQYDPTMSTDRMSRARSVWDASQAPPPPGAAADQTPGLGFTPEFQTGLFGSGDAPMGGQSLNPRMYATDPSAAQLAEILGGSVTATQGAAWPGGSAQNPAAIRLENGGMINAGAVGSRLLQLQDVYRQAMSNYELNQRSNPAIIASGMLQAPTDPYESLRTWAGQQQYTPNQFEVGAQWPIQQLPQGYQRPPQFTPGQGADQAGAGGAAPPAFQGSQQAPEAGQGGQQFGGGYGGWQGMQYGNPYGGGYGVGGGYQANPYGSYANSAYFGGYNQFNPAQGGGGYGNTGSFPGFGGGGYSNAGYGNPYGNQGYNPFAGGAWY